MERIQSILGLMENRTETTIQGVGKRVFGGENGVRVLLNDAESSGKEDGKWNGNWIILRFLLSEL